ncbi:unnamed protein product [Soboliphyme baturini]|uniref:Secreted protein n=1 Tax=Soboliphyme baturini TaxID=241478 RepID=A0A183IPF2_9BILA|nr:unnamed protein product [Soboliphyme baturini]
MKRCCTALVLYVLLSFGLCIEDEAEEENENPLVCEDPGKKVFFEEPSLAKRSTCGQLTRSACQFVHDANKKCPCTCQYLLKGGYPLMYLTAATPVPTIPTPAWIGPKPKRRGFRRRGYNIIRQFNGHPELFQAPPFPLPPRPIV